MVPSVAGFKMFIIEIYRLDSKQEYTKVNELKYECFGEATAMYYNLLDELDDGRLIMRVKAGVMDFLVRVRTKVNGKY